MIPPSGKADDRTGPSQFELEHFLPYQLSLLTNTVSQGIAKSYRDRYDISVTEWRILAVLGRYPGLTASEIVDRTAMDKVAISRAVKSLVGKNLLQRQTDRNDRRRRRLLITRARGEKVLSEVVPRAQDYERLLLKALEPAELKALELTLQKLQAQAQILNQG